MRAQRKEGERLYNLFQEARTEEITDSQKISLLEQAAEKNNPDALKDLAICYRDGEGVESDFNESMRLLKLAAKHGHGEALAYLATCYENGEGVKKDINEAIYYYRLSEEKLSLQNFRMLMRDIEFEKNHPLPLPSRSDKLVKEYHADLLARLQKEEEKIRDNVLLIAEEESFAENEKNILREKLEQYIEQKSLLPDQLEENRKTWENEANTLGDALDMVEVPRDLISTIGGYAAFFQTSQDKDNENEKLVLTLVCPQLQ